MLRSAVQVCLGLLKPGGLAQLARAPALHAGGHRFDSDILHHSFDRCIERFFYIEKIISIRGFTIGSKPGYQQKELVFTATDTRDKNGSEDLVW